MAVRTGNRHDNLLTGTQFNDILNGLAGDDTLIGGAGADRLFGGLGDDVLRGGPGADRLVGGPGNDWADYANAATGVTINLANRFLNTGDAAGDRFFSIERIKGSQFDDNLTGNAHDNVLEGLAGADILNGGGGFDFARYKAAPTGVTASLENPSLNTGHAAGDTYVSIEGLQGSDFADTLIGDAGNNVLIGGAGGDALDGRGGFDFARYDIRAAAIGVTASLADSSINTGDAAGDTYTSVEGLIGTRFRDLLFGDDHANVLRGEAGNDRLYGNLGNDTVLGGSGNDWLNGGYGNDVLNGGSGRDQFIFDTALNKTENVDLIQHFSVRDDTIRLDDAVFTHAGPLGRLAASAFFSGAAAHDAGDRIIYNSTTGALYYDPDGTGAEAQVKFAQLAPKLHLTNADFLVF